MDNSTVVVTGGAGFIGSHLTDALLASGRRVRVIDNFATGRRDQVNSAAELIEADIRDFNAMATAFAGADCIFHVAALPRVPLSIEQPLETHLVNVVGTLNVLLAARAQRVRRVIFSGSSSVYGTQPNLPLHEEMRPNPLNPYALQKLTGEEYTRLFHQLYGLQTLTLRYFNVFGPRMASEGAYVTVMSVFLRARAKGQPLPIHGDGEQSRDFTHVRDVVRANLLAMDCARADGCAINIGQGRNLTINRIAELFGGPTRHGAARPGDARHTLADNRRAAEILNWHPMENTEAAVRELLLDAGRRPRAGG
ncbi:MAG TPA: NAD-dependent epimerase/dehydratase family protein [Candidatus Binataceae bacterium]|nr:NAD-dependent epimerase/dehydratase family protein [Candidatus Binataceae bacterium]